MLTGCDGGGTTGPELGEEDDEEVPELNIRFAQIATEIDSTGIPEELGVKRYTMSLQPTNNNSVFAGRGFVGADGSVIAEMDMSGGQYEYPLFTVESIEAWDYDETYDERLYAPFSLEGTVLSYGEREGFEGLFIKELEAVITGEGHWLDGDTLIFVNRNVE